MDLYKSNVKIKCENYFKIPSNSAPQAEDKSPNIIYDYIKNSKNLFTDN